MISIPRMFEEKIVNILPFDSSDRFMILCPVLSVSIRYSNIRSDSIARMGTSKLPGDKYNKIDSSYISDVCHLMYSGQSMYTVASKWTSPADIHAPQSALR